MAEYNSFYKEYIYIYLQMKPTDLQIAERLAVSLRDSMESISRCERERSERNRELHPRDLNFFTSREKSHKFFTEPSDREVLGSRAWTSDSRYFSTVNISSLALLRMSHHASAGGSIEVMGMMTGKVFDHELVVVDTYPLPVEGTETRVNAQAEGYEFMVQYLQGLKNLGHNEDIIGWYHSHPGYGCWLSGIDVSTQSLNQQFQDPYLAVVIDPTRSRKNGHLEIGAFRTFPDSAAGNLGLQGVDVRNLPKNKMDEFGAHAENYYSLKIKVYDSPFDSALLDCLAEPVAEDNCGADKSSEQVGSMLLGMATRLRNAEPERMTLSLHSNAISGTSTPVSFHGGVEQRIGNSSLEMLMERDRRFRNLGGDQSTLASEEDHEGLSENSDMDEGEEVWMSRKPRSQFKKPKYARGKRTVPEIFKPHTGINKLSRDIRAVALEEMKEILTEEGNE